MLAGVWWGPQFTQGWKSWQWRTISKRKESSQWSRLCGKDVKRLYWRVVNGVVIPKVKGYPWPRLEQMAAENNFKRKRTSASGVDSTAACILIIWQNCSQILSRDHLRPWDLLIVTSMFLNSSTATLVVRMGCLICPDLPTVMSQLHSHIGHPLGNLSFSHCSSVQTQGFTNTKDPWSLLCTRLPTSNPCCGTHFTNSASFPMSPVLTFKPWTSSLNLCYTAMGLLNNSPVSRSVRHLHGGVYSAGWSSFPFKMVLCCHLFLTHLLVPWATFGLFLFDLPSLFVFSAVGER